MKTDVMISVIVPVYCVESYLDKCIMSLIRQDFFSYEILLIDDGSPDRCPAMCDEYEKKYSIIRVIHKKNGGLGDARNCGVKYAKGKYIAFVDSDDYVEADYLSIMWNLINDSNAEMCMMKIRREENDKPKTPSGSKKIHLMSSEEVIFAAYAHEGFGWTAYGKLILRSILLQHPFPSGYYEDSAVMYSIIDECNRIITGDYSFYYHYINRSGSILHSELNEKHFKIFEICDQFEAFINKSYPQLFLVTIIFRRAAITQMLNCQKMTWKQYREIFYKYTNTFRRYWFDIIISPQFTTKNKVYLTVYCTFPIFAKVIGLLRRKIG